MASSAAHVTAEDSSVVRLMMFAGNNSVRPLRGMQCHLSERHAKIFSLRRVLHVTDLVLEQPMNTP